MRASTYEELTQSNREEMPLDEVIIILYCSEVKGFCSCSSRGILLSSLYEWRNSVVAPDMPSLLSIPNGGTEAAPVHKTCTMEGSPDTWLKFAYANFFFSHKSNCNSETRQPTVCTNQ